MKHSTRPGAPAADRATVRVDATCIARGLRALATVLVALAILAPPAHAQSGGRTGGSLPYAKALAQSLTYGGFTNTNCSQAGFTTDAVAHLDIAGHVFLDGQTYLDGVPYDTYAEDLQFGPDTFDTKFFRNVLAPAPASSTYTFQFVSRVLRDETLVGHSITTITCDDGVFAAVNVWEPARVPVPAGHPAAWAALALLLAVTAASRLARRA